MKRVSSYKKAKYRKKLGCKPRQFHDPRKGGQCWSCPRKHRYRSTKAVTSKGACTNGTSATYRSVRIINVSGEKIHFMIQANPGCGAVHKGHSFNCFHANLNDGGQKTYLPSAWIDVAKSAQMFGPVILGAALSFGAGVMTGGGPLAAAVTSVSFDILKKGIAEGISKDDSAAPEGIMMLRVFPKGKVKVGANQVRCFVPQGFSTIYIGKSNSKKGKTQRFTCSLIPSGVIFTGIAFNRASQKKKNMCLPLSRKQKQAKIAKCRRKGKGKTKSWHKDQLLYVYSGNEKGGAIRFARHRRNYCLEAVSKNNVRSAKCSKRGQARGDKQRWRVSPKGQIQNVHWTEQAKTPMCLTTKGFRATQNNKLAVWSCDLQKAKSPKALRWHPMTPSGKYGLQLEGGGSLRHKGQKVKPIHVRNLSGESVDIIFQYRPGCGRVIDGYTYGCYVRKNFKDNAGMVYKPDAAAFAWADWMKDVGISVAKVAAGAGSSKIIKAKGVAGYALKGAASGAMVGATQGADIGSNLSFALSKNKKKTLHENGLIPTKTMIMRVFPKGKRGVKKNQAICVVPITAETIYISRKHKKWSSKVDRFACGYLPKGTTHYGKFMNAFGKCLSFDRKKKRTFVTRCRNKYTNWLHSQVTGALMIDFGKSKNNKRCLTAGKNAKVKLSRCGKAGKPKNKFQKWIYTGGGLFRNDGAKKCLAIKSNNKVVLHSCAEKKNNKTVASAWVVKPH